LKLRRSRITKSSASLAGWIFADLTLLLAIVFASTSLDETTTTITSTSSTTTTIVKSLSSDEITGADTTISSTTTTTTVISCPSDVSAESCGVSGVRPDPVVLVIEDASRMRPSSFRDELTLAVLERTDLPPDPNFGVILIYGGSAGSSDSNVGDRFAAKIQTWLEEWDQVNATTYYQPGHDQSVSQGSVRLKLFPILFSSE
jgi:hypothetical protein